MTRRPDMPAFFRDDGATIERDCISFGWHKLENDQWESPEGGRVMVRSGCMPIIRLMPGGMGWTMWIDRPEDAG
jgi:hypothetical protein